MFATYLEEFQNELDKIEASGTFKNERVLMSPQDAIVNLESGKSLINMCANNYLGLSNHSKLIEAAKRALDDRGFGMSSVRFICGTVDVHKKLEKAVADFHGVDDAILFSSCFDANAGIFEMLMGEPDVIVSDALNHASIIDGIRLCKAERRRYSNADMEELEVILKDVQGKRRILIATDGVFSMDGTLAPLDKICSLAEKYNAMVMVDDSHGVGVVGPGGRGTPAHFKVTEKVDIISSTLGKAMGGASGGYIASHREIVALLRQRARPYLFSNTLPPSLAAAGLEAFKILETSSYLIDKLHENTRYFRSRIASCGFDVPKGESAIVPVMLYDEKAAVCFAEEMLKEGIYVVGFTFPVVPKGKARIRVQLSAAHTIELLDQVISAFETVGKRLNVLK